MGRLTAEETVDLEVCNDDEPLPLHPSESEELEEF